MQQIELGNISIDVELKDIKNIHLSVYPPTGRIRIAAPSKMDLDTIRVFAISKMQWIRKQQTILLNQERESPREYLELESHYFLGERYLLRITERNSPPILEKDHKFFHLSIRPESSEAKRQEIVENWYRTELKQLITQLLPKWEKIIGVECHSFGVKKMRTKWGTCNPDAKRIWLNLELAKKPVECIEYIIVHELVHLLERSHNAQFVKYMDEFMPKWRYHRDILNRLPFSHVDWSY